LEPGNVKRQEIMIAKNFRNDPKAMALQLPLPFAHRLVWALKRPGCRVLRAIRVARGAAFKLAGRIAYPVKAVTPQWFKDASRLAKSLAAAVKAACIFLDFDQDNGHFFTNDELKAMHTKKTKTPEFVAHTYKGEKLDGKPQVLAVKETQAVLCGGKMRYMLNCYGTILDAGFCRSV